MPQGTVGGVRRQMRGELAVGRDIALADAGALANPLVRCLDPLGKLLVGYHARRQIGAASLDHRTDHPSLSVQVAAVATGPGVEPAAAARRRRSSTIAFSLKL